MVVESSRAASWAYSGSRAVSAAAVWIDSSSSSFVLAPSYRPEIVFVATSRASTRVSPAQQRPTALTIFSRRTGS